MSSCGTSPTAPYGEREWVKNARVAGEVELTRALRTRQHAVEELGPEQAAPVLREYLRKWAWEVGKFFEGIDQDSTEAELAAVAPGFPVFTVK